MLSRNLDKALQAYKSRNAGLSRHAHDRPRDEALEEHQQARGQYIKSMVYGGLDGIVTTFAVVAGVAGASLSAGVVLIMGFANLVADGLSMAIGDFLSTKAENEYNRAEREREAWEVENYPEGEKREMVELYTARGMDPGDAQAVTEVLARNKQAWVAVMMAEELGIVESESSPWKHALATFLSFSIFGLIPVAAYVVSRFLPPLVPFTFALSSALTGLTLFILGALKSRFTKRSWLASGAEMLIVGGLAAAAAYGIGLGLSHLVGV
jgi:VIT1/CCC1 family predicted Fe2+/Mn2+ transporter